MTITATTRITTTPTQHQQTSTTPATDSLRYASTQRNGDPAGQGNEQPITIDSGNHRRSLPYGAEQQEFIPLLMDTTLDELPDDTEAYATVMKLFHEIKDERLADCIAEQMSSMSLRQIAGLNPDPVSVSARLEEVLAELRKE